MRAHASEQRAALVHIDEEARTRQETGNGLNPAAVVLKIRELIDDDTTVACDVGSHYKGIRVGSMTEFEDAFKQSFFDPGVTIIDVFVDYTRNTELFAELHDDVVQ